MGGDVVVGLGDTECSRESWSSLVWLSGGSGEEGAVFWCVGGVGGGGSARGFVLRGVGGVGGAGVELTAFLFATLEPSDKLQEHSNDVSSLFSFIFPFLLSLISRMTCLPQRWRWQRSQAV